MIDLNTVIETLGLEPLRGEGGLYRETYRSVGRIPPGALGPLYAGGERPFGSAIYYLLSADPDSFSALHRLLSDEIYHFYLGDPVEMLLLLADGTSQTVILGQDLLAGQRVQTVAPAGAWQGSRLLPGGRFALMGTTMAPGFDRRDFELGERATLCRAYAHEAEAISRLTRV